MRKPQAIDYTRLKAYRAEAKPTKPKRSKAARLAASADVIRRFPKGGEDNVAKVGMR